MCFVNEHQLFQSVTPSLSDWRRNPDHRSRFLRDRSSGDGSSKLPTRKTQSPFNGCSGGQNAVQYPRRLAPRCPKRWLKTAVSQGWFLASLKTSTRSRVVANGFTCGMPFELPVRAQRTSLFAFYSFEVTSTECQASISFLRRWTISVCEAARSFSSCGSSLRL